MAGSYSAVPARSQNITTIGTGLALSSGTLTNTLITGLAGGQTALGGTAASENLTLQSTSHATRGRVVCADRIQAPAGSDSDPGLRLGSTASGFYYESAGPQLRAILGGAVMASFISSGVSSVVAGGFKANSAAITDSALALCGEADSNSGIGIEGSDVLSVVTGGARAISVSRVSGAQRTALYGGTPVILGQVGATLTNNVTSGGTTDVVDNVVAASVDTSAASLVSTRNAMYQIALKLSTMEAKLKLVEAIGT